MSNVVVQAAGWVGTALILTAYGLVSFKKVSADHRLYPILNLAGAVCLGFNVFYLEAWPAFVLEIVWGGIAVASLLRKP